MLNKKEFIDIRRELEKFEAKREKTISSSRAIIKLSKLIIYAIHRGNIKLADKLAKDIKNKINGLSKEYCDINVNKVALYEYVEALSFLEFIKNKKIPLRKELKVDTESYLCGLCDLTGELARKSVDAIIKKNFQQVLEIKNFVNDLYGEFLNLNLRNGELRKKSDAIKWNLSKIEEALFIAEAKGIFNKKFY